MLRAIIGTVLSLTALPVIAAQCLDVFPDPASSYAANGEIEFKRNARLIGSDGILTFNTVTDSSNGRRSCDTGPCVAGPQSAANLVLPSFRESQSSADVHVRFNATATINPGQYDDVTIEQNGRLTLAGMGGTYVMESLHAKFNSTVRLAGGDYWIEDFTVEQGASIQVIGNEPVTIYVEDADFKFNSRLNQNGTPDKFALISYEDVNMEQNARINGFVYAKDSMTMKFNSRITGAVNTADMVMEQNSRVTYAPNALQNVDFGGTCLTSALAPDPISHWPIDICSLSGNLNEVLDVQGGNHGQALNGAGIDFNGQYCQAGQMQGLGDVISIPHTDNYHLNNGTVSFWFMTPDLTFRNRSSAGGMGLFSKDSTGLDNGGHLTLWVTNSGAMRVRLQSANDSHTIQSSNVIVAGQWHHVAFSWGTEGMRLYVDGVLRGSNASFTSGLGNNREPIILGGNAWQTSDGSSPSNQLRDLFKGSIDDLKLFDQQLNAGQVTNLFNIAEGSCNTCSSNATLTAHWPMDLCSVNGDAGEIVDIVGNSSGATVGAAGTINDGKFCQAGRLNGTGGHINIPHTNAMSLTSGSLSMWIKAPDLSFRNTPDVGGMGIFSRDSRNYDGGGHLTLWVDSSGRVHARHQSTSRSYSLNSSSNAIRENKWHHLVYSFGNQRMRLFIDGRLVASNNSFNGGIAGNTEPMIIGATATRSGDGESTPSQLRDFFKGEIDDVRLYQNELSIAEIDGLYQASSYVCTNCTGDRPVAHYQFEQEEYTGPGQVLDSTANAYDADPVGNVEPVLPVSPISCRVLDVPYNTTVRQIDAINTKLDLNQIGGRGTISFWYRSDRSWRNGGSRQLFDASQLANPPRRNNGLDKFFFMVLRSNGTLRFAMEDNLDQDFFADTGRLNFAANEWVHVALTWDLVNEHAQIYLNGRPQNPRLRSGLRTSQIAGLGDLFFGDIGTSYVIVGGTDNSANGQYDDVRVYNFNQTRAQVLADMSDVTPCSTIDHYQIVHPEQALTCSAAEVTIRACADAACANLADVPSTVTLSPSGWDNGDTVTFTGSTTVQLRQPTASLVSIGLASTNPSASVVCNPDCSIEFVNAGLEFFDVNNPSNTQLPIVTAEQDLGVIGIRAVRDNNGACGPLLSGQQTVNLTYDCISEPDAPYSSDTCQVPFAGIGLNANAQGSQSGALTLNFDNAGEARLVNQQYADAGRLALSVSANVQGVSFGSGVAKLNSVPASLQVTESANDPQVAGDGFEFGIEALGQNGAVLPNYQAGQLQLAVQRTQPTGAGNDGGFAYASGRVVNSRSSLTFEDVSATFSNGRYVYADAHYEEVGDIRVAARDLNYLSSTVSSGNLDVGRFIPAYFDVSELNQGTLADTCSASFTYIGQDFGYEVGQEPSVQITAFNALGNITANYTGNLWRLAPDINNLSYADSSGYAGSASVNQLGNLNLTGTAVYDGVGSIDVLASQFVYDKLATPAEPFESQLDLTFSDAFFTDSDGVCYQSSYPNGCESFTISNIQGTQQRYGRLAFVNSFGPESEVIMLPLNAEYFDAGDWRLNRDDSCTPIDLTQSNGDILVSDASTGEFEHNIISLLSPTSASGTLQSGLSDSSDFSLGPPVNASGEALRGTVTVGLSPATGAPWSSYLNIDWNQDGTIDSNDSPIGIATFGILRGNDRTIHWRETFE